MWEVVIPAATGAVGVLVGFVSPRARSLDSQRQDFDKVLESQRKDFETILEPLRDEMQNHRVRIQTLEQQHAADIAQHYQDQRRIDILVDYVKDLLAFIRLHVASPPPPPIPPEFSNDI